MPRVLAIETSSRIGSIALAQDERVLVEEQFAHGLQHAAQIIPIIDNLCRAQHWAPAEVDHVYVSAGPGSFTGLRIGITLAKTLALATGVKLVAVPSVRVLAENAPAEVRHVVIVLDAKRDQIFTARFEWDEAGRWLEREAAKLDSLVNVLARSPRPLHLLGEGIPYHQKFLPSDPQIIVTPPELWRPRASVVARIGSKMAAAGEFVDPDRLTPIYIRRPEAEEKFDALHGSDRI
jgi:tRNA threonylcarbamoyladenosine biosynthesis protein TsaB